MQAPDPRPLARRLEAWFARHRRALPWRETYDPYHVWVSEIMLQQTRVEVVLPYFARFLERFPTLDALARATDHDVMAAWSGLGYYRRAKMLRAGATAVLERFGGELPRDVESLMTIPGIGRYTAGAIASVAFDLPAPIVDGNVARIVSRIFATGDDAWPHAEALVNASRSPRMLNQALMELGALVCKPKGPTCLICPVRELCVARGTNRVDEFPLPKPKKTPRELRIPLYLVTDRRGRILMRREAGPLMNALYHLPHGNDALLGTTPLAATPGALLGTFRHTVTTRRIEFALYTAELRGRKEHGYEWIDAATLADIPHPSYVRKALTLAKSRM